MLIAGAGWNLAGGPKNLAGGPNARSTMLSESAKDGGCKYGTKAYWDSMYRGFGAAADDGLPSDAYSWYSGWRELEPFWRELVPDDKARVLVPGCGNDGTISALYDAGYRALTAFDYSADAVARARELWGDRDIRLLCADATALPFDGSMPPFDAVLDKGALDAIGICSKESLTEAVQELGRVTATGGLVVSVSRALEADVLRGAFDGQGIWEEIRDGGIHICESGEVTTDLAASLYAWCRR